MTLSRRRAMTVCLSALVAGANGCALLERGWFADNDESDGRSSESHVLKPLGSPPTSMQIEIVFIERPTDDPLVGQALWRDLDQVGAVDIQIRETLTKNGFRVGVSSSSPPRALQTLLGLAAEIPDIGAPEDSRKLVGRRISLVSGADSEVQTSPLFEHCQVQTFGEKPQTGDYENARCVFRMRAQRVQDGWAKLEFTPEIHYGEHKLRQKAEETGWQLRTAQRIVPFHSQRFELTLNQGEMAVIAPTGEEPKSLGRHFFLGEGEVGAVQRVLIVRLADMARTELVYAKHDESGVRR